MIQGCYKIKFIISGLVLLMLSLCPSTANAQPFKYLGGVWKGLGSTPKIADNFVHRAMRKFSYTPEITPISLDAVLKGRKYSNSFLESPAIISIPTRLKKTNIIECAPIPVTYNKDWKNHLLLTDADNKGSKYSANLHNNPAISLASNLQHLESAAGEQPQKMNPDEVSIQHYDEAKVSITIDANSWWIEYIAKIIEEQMLKQGIDKMEKQMFKNGMHIDFEIEEDEIGYIIIYRCEYKLDEA